MKYESLSHTRHARERMRQREISEEDILRIINNPDLTYPSYGKTVADELLGGARELRIVYAATPEGEADARIISVIDLLEGR